MDTSKIKDERVKAIVRNALIGEYAEAHKRIKLLIGGFRSPELVLEMIYILGKTDGIATERARRKEKALTNVAASVKADVLIKS